MAIQPLISPGCRRSCKTTPGLSYKQFSERLFPSKIKQNQCGSHTHKWKEGWWRTKRRKEADCFLSDHVINSSVVSNQYSCTPKGALKQLVVNTMFFKKGKVAQNVNRTDEEVDRKRRRRIQQRRGEVVVTHVQRQSWCDRAAAARWCWKKNERLHEGRDALLRCWKQVNEWKLRVTEMSDTDWRGGQREIKTCWRVFQQHIKIVWKNNAKRKWRRGSWMFK